MGDRPAETRVELPLSGHDGGNGGNGGNGGSSGNGGPRPKKGMSVYTGERKSYQTRALVRKTLSHQKRQMCTNICCVGCCPLLLVAICGILGIVVTQLLTGLQPANPFVQFCSGNLTLNPLTLTPGTLAKNAADYQLAPISQSSTLASSCMAWFGDATFASAPYSPAPGPAVCAAGVHSDLCPTNLLTMVPEPAIGYFPPAANVSAPVAAGVYQVAWARELYFGAWASVAGNAELLGLLGTKPQMDTFAMHGSGPAPEAGSGLLGAIPSRYFVDGNTSAYQPDAPLIRLPYFSLINGDESDLDDATAAQIIQTITDLLSIPYARNSSDYVTAARFTLREMPAVNVIVHEISEGLFNFTLQSGNNPQLIGLSQSQTVTTTAGLRILAQLAWLDQAIGTQFGLNVSLTQGLRVFPSNVNLSFTFSVGSYVGQILYPFGVSFLLPIYVISLVQEKEERILIMMKMNGLKLWVYYLTEYLHFYALHVGTIAIFIATGWAFQLEFFTQTDAGVYLLLFFIWGHVQVTYAFFLATFFSKSRLALIVVFLIVLAGVIINIACNTLFDANKPTPWPYFIYPPFAFYRCVILINKASFDAALPKYTMSMLVPGDDVFTAMFFMFVEVIILGLVTAYLALVLPREYGVRRPWHFPISDLVRWALRRCGGKVSTEDAAAPHGAAVALDEHEVDVAEEDDDVRAERARVLENQHSADCPVVVKEMRKEFGYKVAVKRMTLALETNLVFGLLGPNGAGKTTLINILTGLYEATSGDGYLAGHKVGADMDQVYMNIGVCPQHDILWGSLTVEEHLLFYARLKGIPPSEEAETVNEALATVGLLRFRDRQSKGLSGGEKRRLSIAISLIGRGLVVFLDEPTTGLDPEVRRLVWNIIQEQRHGRTVILTTHSMEEADVLCQKLAIMAKGTMRCIGPQVRLKNLYGSGFRLQLTARPGELDKATSYIESLLPANFKRLLSFSSSATYEFGGTDGIIGRLFADLGEHMEEHAIIDWGVSQTSLEEVFLRIIRDADAEAD